MIKLKTNNINSLSKLAKVLASHTHAFKEQILTILENEDTLDKQPLLSFYNMLSKYTENLSKDQFADICAQIAIYCLLVARKIEPKFSGLTITKLLSYSPPLVRNFLEYISKSSDTKLQQIINSIIEILTSVDLNIILEFQNNDLFMYFYENFLQAFDPKTRKYQGVYFTPEPVVSFIVKSVQSLLISRFKKDKGFADPTVSVLDPALGTGTFLKHIIHLIYDTDKSKIRSFNNLYGFELSIVSYVIAYMKLAITLKELGYELKENEYPRIYLTNTLKIQTTRSIFSPVEEDPADVIKTKAPILVIIGNPPYSGTSSNINEWITKLVKDYRIVDGKPYYYVKFIKFGQWKIDQTGQGILAFITNHSYLDNFTYCGMRQSLLNSFTDIYILNLHGSILKKEKCPDGSKDENVFDVRVGVVIGIFVKEKDKIGPAKVHYADLWGTREHKYTFLSKNFIETLEWQELDPHSPDYFFVPRKETLIREYEENWSVKDISPVNNTGIMTARDKFAIDFEEETLLEKIQIFCDESLSDKEIAEKFGLKNTQAFNLEESRTRLIKDKNWKLYIKPILYRPFDLRYIYYNELILEGPRWEIMRHMLARENLGLCIGRAGQAIGPNPWDIAIASNHITAFHLFRRGGNTLFPLYLYFDEKDRPLSPPRPNLNPDFLKLVAERTGRERTPEEIFYYIYGILYTPIYRERYAEFLKYDFPRIPVFSAEIFEKISNLGAELVELHLMKRIFPKPKVSYPVFGSDIIEKVRYNEATKQVWINDEQYFDGVEPSAWNYHIGGYQVLAKWLKERKKRGKPLTKEMIEHFRQIHEILFMTIEIENKLSEIWLKSIQ